jgi:hypothetical protein
VLQSFQIQGISSDSNRRYAIQSKLWKISLSREFNHYTLEGEINQINVHLEISYWLIVLWRGGQREHNFCMDCLLWCATRVKRVGKFDSPIIRMERESEPNVFNQQLKLVLVIFHCWFLCTFHCITCDIYFEYRNNFGTSIIIMFPVLLLVI